MMLRDLSQMPKCIAHEHFLSADRFNRFDIAVCSPLFSTYVPSLEQPPNTVIDKSHRNIGGASLLEYY